MGILTQNPVATSFFDPAIFAQLDNLILETYDKVVGTFSFENIAHEPIPLIIWHQ